MHIWFLFDEYAAKYRVGRSDWPGDVFEMLQPEEFAKIEWTCEKLGIKLVDVSGD